MQWRKVTSAKFPNTLTDISGHHARTLLYSSSKPLISGYTKIGIVIVISYFYNVINT